MPNSKQVELMTEFQDISIGHFENYADQWAAGQISLKDYEMLFKQELKDNYIATVWTARGSTNVGQRDYGLAGRRLRDQYQFAHGFFKDIEAGKLSLNEIKARSALYARSSRQVLEQVGNDQPGLPRLPHYPADGSTPCKTNDKCTVDVEAVENGFDVFWRLHPAEHCPTCVSRKNGSPLRVRFGVVENAGAWG